MRHDPATVPAEDDLGQALLVIEAGSLHDEASLDLLERSMASPHAILRRHGLVGLERRGALSHDDLIGAIGDPDPENRSRALRCAARGSEASADLIEAITLATSDPVDYVAVAAVRTIGDLEIHDALELVISLATSADDAMAREEAVAAIASLGDPRGLQAIVAASEDKPAIRRRCVAALGAFEGDLVEATLDRLSTDRDWQVRQAVAMLRRGELS